MVQASTSDRDTMMAELRTHCEKRIANRDNCKVIYTSKKEQLTVWEQYEEDGTYGDVSILTVPDVSLEQLGLIFGDITQFVAWNNKFDESSEMKLLEDLGDNKYYISIKAGLPWPMSNRTAIVTLYKDMEEKDGGSTDLMTTKGNEAKVEQYKDIIGKDVVPEFRFVYNTVRATDDGKGFVYTATNCFSLGGSVPKSVMNMLIKQGCADLERFAKQVREDAAKLSQ